MFTTKEVCELCELPVPTLTDWVRKGCVVPVVRGGIGRGKTHLFSHSQAFGLVLVAALHDELGGHLGPAFVRDLMEEAGRIPDRDMEAWLSPVKTPWTEETAARCRALAPLLPLVEDPPPEWLPRINRVLGEISRRLGGQTQAERDAGRPKYQLGDHTRGLAGKSKKSKRKA